MSETRFVDEGTHLFELKELILVRCSRCEGSARLRSSNERVRVTCSGCGHSRDWVRQPKKPFCLPGTGPRLDYFELELLLQAPCCGHVLWAYNEAHLSFMESFVRATLREHSRDPEHGWANSSLASRLPKWFKSAKNREPVGRGLAELRTLIDRDLRA